MRRLQGKGVSAILDYAAEDDTPQQQHQQQPAGAAPAAAGKAPAAGPSSSAARPGVVKGDSKEAVARVYDYASEQQCDR